jgi:hypothetical protein
MSEVQRIALARSLASRLACLGLDEIRLIDHVVTRLELGRERYGELDLSAPRDWGKELGEELVDALVYQAARELAAQDLARASVREAARAEMLGDQRPPRGTLTQAARARFDAVVASFAPAPDLAIATEPATEFAPEQHLTVASPVPARIAATPDASGGDPYEEVLFDEHGLPHTCVVRGVDDHDDHDECGRVFGGEAG